MSQHRELKLRGFRLEVGTKLLLDSLAQMHLQDNTVIQYALDTPYPISTSLMCTFTDKRIEVIEQFEFALTRETRRFEWKETQTQIGRSQRLVFRTLDDIGEDAFINTVMRVSENSLDRILQQETEKLGLEQYANEKFKNLKAFKYKPEWWQLAYTQDGSLVGLIIPVENDGGPNIGYIGVIPEHRGQGYVLEDNGVAIREKDDYYMPEIFRLGLGFSLTATARPAVMSLERRAAKQGT